MRYPVSGNRFIRCREGTSKGSCGMNGKAEPTKKRFSKATEILPDAAHGAANRVLYSLHRKKWEGIERG